MCLHALSGNLLQQEYTLAHLEPPDSLEAAEAGIRKFEDFLGSMENNRDKVLSPVDSGNKLVAEGNLYSDKIKEKVQLIEDRYSRAPGPRGPQSHRGVVVPRKDPKLSTIEPMPLASFPGTGRTMRRPRRPLSS